MYKLNTLYIQIPHAYVSFKVKFRPTVCIRAVADLLQLPFG
jgi:hypothetical protein